MFIADLIAYPLTRHVLNPQAVNLGHEPDNSSDRGHPNPNKWNTSIVLCAKIDIISESSKFFSNFICSSTKISTIFNTFNTNCINIVTIIRTITSFSN